jgi:hypothetical protein
VQLSAAQLSASDIDDPAAGLLFTVSAVTHGQFELSTAPSAAVLTFTQGQITAGQVLFVHDASSIAPSYDVSVSDGTLNAGPAPASISFNTASPVSTSSPSPVLPPSSPSQVSGSNSPGETAPPKPVPLPVASQSSTTSADDTAGDSSHGGGGGGGEGSGEGGADAGALDTYAVRQSSAAVSSARKEIGALAPVKSGSGPHEFAGTMAMDSSLLIHGADPELIKFEGNSPADWSISSTFNDNPAGQRKEEFAVVLDTAQLGGIGLSVGVVWWASRLTGVVGSLLASAPAWRHLDPLPVISGGGTDEDDWRDDAQDLDAEADDLAISMFLDARSESAEPMTA